MRVYVRRQIETIICKWLSNKKKISKLIIKNIKTTESEAIFDIFSSSVP